jgi:hypothetical protein
MGHQSSFIAHQRYTSFITINQVRKSLESMQKTVYTVKPATLNLPEKELPGLCPMEATDLISKICKN